MNKKLFFGIFSLTSLSFLFVILQLLSIQLGLQLGLFVVDAVSLKKSLLIYNILNSGFDSLTGVIGQVLSFYSLFILYFWTGAPFGFPLDFLTNLLLSILAWKNTLAIARLEASKVPNLYFYALIFWFLNPYCLSVMLFPNKEIFLFFLTTGFAKNVISGKYFWALLYLPIVYVTRDGHALALLASILAYLGIKHLRVKGWQIISLAFLLVSIASQIDLTVLGGAFERNVSVGQSGSYGSGGNNLNPLAAAIINWLNFSFRPQFFSAEGVYVINFGFWLLGISVFFALPKAYLTIWKSSQSNLFSSLLLFSISMALVVSSYSQQRYFLPFLPMIIIILAGFRPRIVFSFLLMTLVTYPILDKLNLLPPLQVGVSSSNLREIGLQ